MTGGRRILRHHSINCRLKQILSSTKTSRTNTNNFNVKLTSKSQFASSKCNMASATFSMAVIPWKDRTELTDKIIDSSQRKIRRRRTNKGNVKLSELVKCEQKASGTRSCACVYVSRESVRACERECVRVCVSLRRHAAKNERFQKRNGAKTAGAWTSSLRKRARRRNLPGNWRGSLRASRPSWRTRGLVLALSFERESDAAGTGEASLLDVRHRTMPSPEAHQTIWLDTCCGCENCKLANVKIADCQHYDVRSSAIHCFRCLSFVENHRFADNFH